MPIATETRKTAARRREFAYVYVMRYASVAEGRRLVALCYSSTRTLPHHPTPRTQHTVEHAPCGTLWAAMWPIWEGPDLQRVLEVSAVGGFLRFRRSYWLSHEMLTK